MYVCINIYIPFTHAHWFGRYVALSKGENELTPDTWREACSLEAERSLAIDKS